MKKLKKLLLISVLCLLVCIIGMLVWGGKGKSLEKRRSDEKIGLDLGIDEIIHMGDIVEMQYQEYADGYYITNVTDYEVVDLYIPNEYDGHQIVGITSAIVDDCEKLERITVADGIKYIGGNAFAFNDHVSEIHLPDSVELIYDKAFMGAKIQSLKVPDKVESIEFSTFANCTALEEIEIGSEVKRIGRYAFANCCSLKEITLPASVTWLGKGAFHRCENLKNITFYTMDMELGRSLFAECDTENLTIYGYRGSRIEEYALEEGLRFCYLDGGEVLPEEDVEVDSQMYHENMDYVQEENTSEVNVLELVYLLSNYYAKEEVAGTIDGLLEERALNDHYYELAFEATINGIPGILYFYTDTANQTNDLFMWTTENYELDAGWEREVRSYVEQLGLDFVSEEGSEFEDWSSICYRASGCEVIVNRDQRSVALIVMREVEE